MAGLAEGGVTGPLVAVEQAILSGTPIGEGSARIHRRESAPRPLPGLRYVADGDGARALVKVTGVMPGAVEIGDRGRLVLRRVAVRSGVPDYGCAFEPDSTGSDA